MLRGLGGTVSRRTLSAFLRKVEECLHILSALNNQLRTGADKGTLLLSDPVKFKLDFSSTTNYASAFEVKRVDQDGYASGSLSGLSVDDKGFLRGQFTNGRTVVAGRLQLATFRGLGGLREVSNNTYQATEQSGEPLVGSGAEGIYGSIRSNSVEEANTDMAGELVRLMVQQRNYQLTPSRYVPK